ncbi:hypothetical protein KKG41_01615 [Patescibacteria group bacterium]|nr:hypothetical protein [Patescibacteria group bacterium]
MDKESIQKAEILRLRRVIVELEKKLDELQKVIAALNLHKVEMRAKSKI